MDFRIFSFARGGDSGYSSVVLWGMSASLPEPPNVLELVARLRALLKNAVDVDNFPYSADVATLDAQRASIGDAVDAVDAWDQEGYVETEDPSLPSAHLSLSRFTARVRRAHLDAEVDALIAQVADEQRAEARQIADRLSPGSRSQLSLPPSSTNKEIIVRMANNPGLTQEEAWPLVEWFVKNLDPHMNDKYVTGLFERFPQILVSHGRSLFAMTASGDTANNEVTCERQEQWYRVILPFLLERNILTVQEMTESVHRLASYPKSDLIMHSMATSALWLAVVKEEHEQSWSARMAKSSDLRALMNHKAAMAVPEVRKALSGCSPAGFGSRAKFLVQLLRRVPPEGVADVLPALLEEDAAEGMVAIRNLPAAHRQMVCPADLGEIAATHPDAKVRQEAILFVKPIGEDVKVRTRRRTP